MAAPVFLDRVYVNTATTGTGSSITLGTVKSPAFNLVSEAGGNNGDLLSYIIEDGTDYEIQRAQAYTASGTLLARGTPVMSKIGGTKGTTQLTLSGSATVRVIILGEDIATGNMTPAQAAANTAGKVISAPDIKSALAYVSIAYASPITAWDLATGINFNVAITANATLNFPANPSSAIGKSGILEVLSSGGAFALSFQASAGFTFEAGSAPTNDNVSGRYTRYVWHCRSATEVQISLMARGVR